MSGHDIVETEVFGKEVSFPYAHHWVGYSLVLMRVTIGWLLLAGGLSKLFDPTWSAQGYLQNAVAATNPFSGVFSSMAGSAVVDWLVIIGLLACGVSVILGLFTRLGAFFGAVMMFLFYLSSWQGGLLQFIPLEHGYIVNEHIIYIMVLLGVSAFGSGQILGLDSKLQESQFVKNRPWMRHILG